MTLGPERVQELIDKQEIQELVLRAMHAMDRCDVAMLGSLQRLDRSHALYAPSQEAEHVVAAVKKVSKSSMHFVGSCLIDLDGDRAAGQTTYVSYLVEDRDGVEYLRTRGARRMQEFTRIDGRWLITATATISDWSRLDAMGEPLPPSGAGMHQGARSRDDYSYAFLPSMRPVVGRVT